VDATDARLRGAAMPAVSSLAGGQPGCDQRLAAFGEVVDAGHLAVRDGERL
jgi:hypothetical protein